MSESFARETLNQIRKKLGMSDNAKDLIEALRLQGWDEQAELIEQLEYKNSMSETTICALNTAWDQALDQRNEAQTKLAKAVKCLQWYADHCMPKYAGEVLAELEAKE